jgi:hypothetical protein
VFNVSHAIAPIVSASWKPPIEPLGFSQLIFRCNEPANALVQPALWRLAIKRGK